MHELSLAITSDLIDALAERVAELLATRSGTGADRSDSPYLTADEAAALLRCGVRRIYRMADDGRLVKVKDGGRLLVTRASLEMHLSKQG